MAKKKISAIKTFLMSIVCLIVGLAVGFVANIYLSLPESYSIPQTIQGQSTSNISTGNIDSDVVVSNALSIHFLELGNKYTGDCTFVKVGNTEMLIDAGSKASSIPHIKSYIDNYCTDGILEYVVVTHAHEDHYAGFATNQTTDSLFDLYNVKTIIDFGSATNKTASNKMYANYIRELEAEVEAGAKHYSALDCVRGHNGASREYYLNEEETIYFEILYQKFYDKSTNQAHTENDYSVCFQIREGNKKYLFTGDLEEDGEASLISCTENEGRIGKVELYKAGHHGSKTSSTADLMAAIEPKIVCVCCCAGSSEYTTKKENQFPTQKFIDNVYTYSPMCKVYVTTLCLNYQEATFESFNGNIVVCSNGTMATYVYCSNNTNTLNTTDWFLEIEECQPK